MYALHIYYTVIVTNTLMKKLCGDAVTVVVVAKIYGRSIN